MLRRHHAPVSNHANANIPTTLGLVSRVTGLHQPSLFDFSNTQFLECWALKPQFCRSRPLKSVTLPNVAANTCLFLHARVCFRLNHEIRLHRFGSIELDGETGFGFQAVPPVPAANAGIAGVIDGGGGLRRKQRHDDDNDDNPDDDDDDRG